jgi:serine/threonine protein kinase
VTAKSSGSFGPAAVSFAVASEKHQSTSQGQNSSPAGGIGVPRTTSDAKLSSQPTSINLQKHYSNASRRSDGWAYNPRIKALGADEFNKPRIRHSTSFNAPKTSDVELRGEVLRLGAKSLSATFVIVCSCFVTMLIVSTPASSAFDASTDAVVTWKQIDAIASATNEGSNAFRGESHRGTQADLRVGRCGFRGAPLENTSAKSCWIVASGDDAASAAVDERDGTTPLGRYKGITSCVVDDMLAAAASDRIVHNESTETWLDLSDHYDVSAASEAQRFGVALAAIHDAHEFLKCDDSRDSTMLTAVWIVMVFALIIVTMCCAIAITLIAVSQEKLVETYVEAGIITVLLVEQILEPAVDYFNALVAEMQPSFDAEQHVSIDTSPNKETKQQQHQQQVTVIEDQVMPYSASGIHRYTQYMAGQQQPSYRIMNLHHQQQQASAPGGGGGGSVSSKGGVGPYRGLAWAESDDGNSSVHAGATNTLNQTSTYASEYPRRQDHTAYELPVASDAVMDAFIEELKRIPSQVLHIQTFSTVRRLAVPGGYYGRGGDGYNAGGYAPYSHPNTTSLTQLANFASFEGSQSGSPLASPKRSRRAMRTAAAAAAAGGDHATTTNDQLIDYNAAGSVSPQQNPTASSSPRGGPISFQTSAVLETQGSSSTSPPPALMHGGVLHRNSDRAVRGSYRSNQGSPLHGPKDPHVVVDDMSESLNDTVSEIGFAPWSRSKPHRSTGSGVFPNSTPTTSPGSGGINSLPVINVVGTQDPSSSSQPHLRTPRQGSDGVSPKGEKAATHAFLSAFTAWAEGSGSDGQPGSGPNSRRSSALITPRGDLHGHDGIDDDEDQVVRRKVSRLTEALKQARQRGNGLSRRGSYAVSDGASNAGGNGFDIHSTGTSPPFGAAQDATQAAQSSSQVINFQDPPNVIVTVTSASSLSRMDQPSRQGSHPTFLLPDHAGSFGGNSTGNPHAPASRVPSFLAYGPGHGAANGHSSGNFQLPEGDVEALVEKLQDVVTFDLRCRQSVVLQCQINDLFSPTLDTMGSSGGGAATSSPFTYDMLVSQEMSRSRNNNDPPGKAKRLDRSGLPSHSLRGREYLSQLFLAVTMHTIKAYDGYIARFNASSVTATWNAVSPYPFADMRATMCAQHLAQSLDQLMLDLDAGVDLYDTTPGGGELHLDRSFASSVNSMNGGFRRPWQSELARSAPMSALMFPVPLRQQLALEFSRRWAIGISAGQLLIGHSGTDDTLFMSQVGEAYTYATKLAALAPQLNAHVLLAESCVAGARSHSDVIPVDVLALGNAGPKLVFELRGPNHTNQQFHVTHALSESTQRLATAISSAMTQLSSANYNAAVTMLENATQALKAVFVASNNMHSQGRNRRVSIAIAPGHNEHRTNAPTALDVETANARQHIRRLLETAKMYQSRKNDHDTREKLFSKRQQLIAAKQLRESAITSSDDEDKQNDDDEIMNNPLAKVAPPPFEDYARRAPGWMLHEFHAFKLAADIEKFGSGHNKAALLAGVPTAVVTTATPPSTDAGESSWTNTPHTNLLAANSMRRTSASPMGSPTGDALASQLRSQILGRLGRASGSKSPTAPLTLDPAVVTRVPDARDDDDEDEEDDDRQSQASAEGPFAQGDYPSTHVAETAGRRFSAAGTDGDEADLGRSDMSTSRRSRRTSEFVPSPTGHSHGSPHRNRSRSRSLASMTSNGSTDSTGVPDDHDDADSVVQTIRTNSMVGRNGIITYRDARRKVWKRGHRVLGRGAVGTVYLGMSPTGELVAVKTIPLPEPELTSPPIVDFDLHGIHSDTPTCSQTTVVPYLTSSLALRTPTSASGYQMLENSPKGGAGPPTAGQRRMSLAFGAMSAASSFHGLNTNNPTPIDQPKTDSEELIQRPSDKQQQQLVLSEIEKVISEISTLSHIRHPNVVSYLSSIVCMDELVIVMEFMPGGSLTQLIQRFGPPPMATVRSVVHGILSGLTALHRRNIVHCDVSPNNVLVGNNGAVKLSDFGCSVTLGNIGGGGVAGTPAFMAPEACRGAPEKASDVWSVGVLILYLLLGQIPYAQVLVQNPAELVRRLALIGKDFKSASRSDDTPLTPPAKAAPGTFGAPSSPCKDPANHASAGCTCSRKNSSEDGFAPTVIVPAAAVSELRGAKDSDLAMASPLYGTGATSILRYVAKEEMTGSGNYPPNKQNSDSNIQRQPSASSVDREVLLGLSLAESCLVSDPSKRPTAERLLKHGFFHS